LSSIAGTPQYCECYTYVVFNFLEFIMLITNPNTLKQALANIRLESLSLSQDVKFLLDKALTEPTITTTQILELLRGK